MKSKKLEELTYGISGQYLAYLRRYVANGGEVSPRNASLYELLVELKDKQK